MYAQPPPLIKNEKIENLIVSMIKKYVKKKYEIEENRMPTERESIERAESSVSC